MATVAVKCRFCGLIDTVKKDDTGNGGHPCYGCQNCHPIFQLDHPKYTTRSLALSLNASITSDAVSTH